MSNYSKLTNFASKDSLASGNPLKVIKGTEIDDEFESIETAIGTKADLASPTFTGTPAAPTAASGTNSTQIATTAFVTTTVNTAVAAIDLSSLYPVGSVYINATVATNPATLIGFGTWVAFGTGRVLVGLDSGDTDFDTVEETGGSKTHTLTVDELPTHKHDYAVAEYDGPYDYGTNYVINNVSETTTGRNRNANTETVGGDQAFSIMNPYITVYMWKRTA
jgi:hypothetical protein